MNLVIPNRIIILFIMSNKQPHGKVKSYDSEIHTTTKHAKMLNFLIILNAVSTKKKIRTDLITLCKYLDVKILHICSDRRLLSNKSNIWLIEFKSCLHDNFDVSLTTLVCKKVRPGTFCQCSIT